MYKIPIRLWSTVVSQLATLPCFQSTTGTVSALAATRRRSLVDVLLEVGEQRLQLLVRPAGTDGRHAPATLGHDLVEPGRLRDDRVRSDRRTVVALRLHPVACRADALDLGTPELRRRGRADVLVVVRLRRRDHPRAHRFVVEPAELGALADVRLGGVGLEPRVVRPAGNRVGLAAEITVQISSSRVWPCTCAPSALRGRPRLRYFQMKRTSVVSTTTKMIAVKTRITSYAVTIRCAFGECGVSGVKPPFAATATFAAINAARTTTGRSSSFRRSRTGILWGWRSARV